MANISLFNFEGSNVRVHIDEKGEPWFVAKDVAEGLDITWTGHVVQHVPDRWKSMVSVTTSFGQKDTTVLSEAGLNFFVFRSDKPKALPFQEWLAGEVLPSIRKTGSYGHQAPAPLMLKSEAESRAAIIRDTALWMQNLVPGIRPEMAAACTARALVASGLVDKPAHEELRNMLSVDWDNAPSLTPTQIGEKLGGIQAVMVNKMLAINGLQKKVGKRWEPTELGKTYAGAVSYQAEHSDHKGVQLKWAPEVVKVLQDARDNVVSTDSKLLT